MSRLSDDTTEPNPILNRYLRSIHTATPTETPVELANSLANQYHRLSDKTVQRDRHLQMIAAGAYYCAAKTTHCPLDATDIVSAEPVSIDRNTILDAAQDIATVTGISADKFSNSIPYIDHYCDELGLPSEIADRATEIVELLIDSPKSSGRSPTGWAAAAVYTATVESDSISVSQRTLADIAHVSPVTIRTSHYTQIEHLPDSFDT